jgi:serine/threonine protein kinase
MINHETHEVTIIDFGLCDFITKENSGAFTRRVGSEEYCPVELIEKTEKPYEGTKVDVFCLGVVLYALLTATFPFDVRKRKQAVRSGQAVPALKLPAVSNECKDLLAKMLESNPEQRISIEKIFGHSWVSQL